VAHKGGHGSALPRLARRFRRTAFLRPLAVAGTLAHEQDGLFRMNTVDQPARSGAARLSAHAVLDGQSWFEARAHGVSVYQDFVESGETVTRAPGPYVAEAVPLVVENDYLVVGLPDRSSS